MTALGEIRFDSVTPDPLVAFLAAHAASPLDSLAAAIRATCDGGDGFWMDPNSVTGSDNSHRRPATHLFEIQLHGISATGFSLEQAADSWRKMALCTLFPEAI